MPSYVELRPPHWSGRDSIRIEMPRDIVQDLATTTKPGWLVDLIDAVMIEQPDGYRRFLLGLEQGADRATMVFGLAADQHCAAAEVVRYVPEAQKRRA